MSDLRDRLHRRLTAIANTDEVRVVAVRDEDVIYTAGEVRYVRRYYVDPRGDLWLHHKASPLGVIPASESDTEALARRVVDEGDGMGAS